MQAGKTCGMRIPVHEWSGVTWVVGGQASAVSGSFFLSLTFKRILFLSYIFFFAREISLCSHRSLFARRFVLSFDFDYSE